MKPVSKRQRNPFDFQPPCTSPSDRICGYGDPAADFHVIGDYPAKHGGSCLGVPFTKSLAGSRLQTVLEDADLLPAGWENALIDTNTSDPATPNLYLSYRYMCAQTPDGRPPTEGQYRSHARFVDAELRAVNAHVLIGVGERTSRWLVEEHTTLAGKVPDDIEALHARDLRGRGFLVILFKDPAEWSSAEQSAAAMTLERVHSSDYRVVKGVPTRIG